MVFVGFADRVIGDDTRTSFDIRTRFVTNVHPCVCSYVTSPLTLVSVLSCSFLPVVLFSLPPTAFSLGGGYMAGIQPKDNGDSSLGILS